MGVRINGAARGGEFISNNLQFYTLYTKTDITMTGNYTDATQKDFDAMVQLIAGFSQVIISNDPVGVSDLDANGAPSLTGAGYIFKFATEIPGAHSVDSLKDELNGIVLNGGVIDTKSTINMEFTKQDLL